MAIRHELVTGRWSRLVEDGIHDVDHQLDEVPLSGIVVFSPVFPEGVQAARASDPVRLVTLGPVRAIVADGELTSLSGTHNEVGDVPGSPGQELPVEIGGTPIWWRAEFDLRYRDTSVPLRSLIVDATDGPVELSDLLDAQGFPPAIPGSLDALRAQIERNARDTKTWRDETESLVAMIDVDTGLIVESRDTAVSAAADATAAAGAAADSATTASDAATSAGQSAADAAGHLDGATDAANTATAAAAAATSAADQTADDRRQTGEDRSEVSSTVAAVSDYATDASNAATIATDAAATADSHALAAAESATTASDAATRAEDAAELADGAAVQAVTERVDTLLAGAPEAYDTLAEIADKLAEQDDLADSMVAQIGEKVTQTTIGNRLHGTNSGGNPALIQYESAATRNTIPYRRAGGEVSVGEPGEVDDAATKGYVDDRGPVSRVVDELPETPDPDTIYFIRES